jgi:hypothetical protein
VDSRNKVSFGGILWNTTLEIDDFPLLSKLAFDNFYMDKDYLTFVVPSAADAASPSQQSLRPVEELWQHLACFHLPFSEGTFGSVHRYDQVLAMLY